MRTRGSNEKIACRQRDRVVTRARARVDDVEDSYIQAGIVATTGSRKRKMAEQAHAPSRIQRRDLIDDPNVVVVDNV